MTKSIVTTYFLWFLGGFFGLHHFYLGRDCQAFLWWATLGGFFGLGWISDVWNIPSYVAEANEDDETFEARLKNEVKQRGKSGPSVSMATRMAQFMTGNLFGYLALHCLPEHLIDAMPFLGTIQLAAFPVFVLVGVHVVGSINLQHSANLRRSFFAAFAPMIFLMESDTLMFWVVSVTKTVYNWNLDFKSVNGDSNENNTNNVTEQNGTLNPRDGNNNELPGEEKKHVKGPGKKNRSAKRGTWTKFGKRVLGLTLAGSLYLAAVSSLLLYNIKIDSEGEKIRIIDAVSNFFKSPAWKDLEEAFKQVWTYYQQHGFWMMWEQIKEALDLGGHQSSCDVLGLNCNSYTEKEVRTRCRQLSREWHPDKFRDETKKAEAQETFMRVQQACSKLSQRHKAKEKTNKKDSETFQ